ncbi:histidine kinase N-terminal 7TM domain-containing protein [Halorubrum sp. AD140]|uniref:histidine kinase N-terminal 7TM domain-containing protein n=1 Tax=Halorubrum sp. AD140 TaxID=3050073 RepID=UPI002ACC54AD|nr:histidine kinase N-terminal 7TM domain-containing protein [Halorubrum sp. AD140]MDZ5810983.1 histidine kinase N-terminal 7TM domain-containing protein [Halorubrum sp. AD140]
MIGLSPLSVALLAAVVTGTSAAILAWRERPEAGAGWLTALLVGQVWWTAFLVFELEASTLAAKALWYDVQWVGVVLIPVAWVLFALAYTGRDRYVTPGSVAALFVVPALTVAVVATGDPGGLVVGDRAVADTEVGSFLRVTPGPWYYAIAGYTYLLGVVGSVPILQLVRDEAYPFRGQSAALLVGTAAPWVSSLLHLAGAIPVPGLDPTPLAFAVSGVAYLLALSRFRLLTLAPAPRRRARQLVFEHLHDPAFVVGTEGYVVDLNQSAVDTFGIDRRSAVGEPADRVVPRYEAIADEEGDPSPLTIVGSDGRRPYEATVREVSDAHGRPNGRVVVFHDVGEYLGQQQRLNVLNRVFRHDVRTETNLIHGYADRLQADPSDERALSIVKESASRILELSERTRTASELFDPSSELHADVPLGEVVDEVAADLRGEFPHARVSVADDLPAASVPAVLRVVAADLCSNAVRHNDAEEPSVWIGATSEDGWVDLVVADDGPGIDPAEYEALERGTETPLEHGSGIGLWIVKWGVDQVGGTVSFAARDPRGTAVTVRVPTGDAAPVSDPDVDGGTVDSTADEDGRGGVDAGR